MMVTPMRMTHRTEREDSLNHMVNGGGGMGGEEEVGGGGGGGGWGRSGWGGARRGATATDDEDPTQRGRPRRKVGGKGHPMDAAAVLERPTGVATRVGTSPAAGDSHERGRAAGGDGQAGGQTHAASWRCRAGLQVGHSAARPGRTTEMETAMRSVQRPA